MGPPPKPSASGFGGERRCDGVSELCPVSQGQGEGYTVRTDETEGLYSCHFHGIGLPARQGRSAGVHFDWPKWTKSHLGRSPLRTSLGVPDWACVKAMVGPSPLLWPLFVPPHQATLGSWPCNWAVSTSGPTLEKRRSRRRGFAAPSCCAAVGEGLAPPESTRAMPGNRRAGQATAPTPATQEMRQFSGLFCAKPSRTVLPSPRTLGTAAHPGKALAVEAQTSTEAGTFCGTSTPSM